MRVDPVRNLLVVGGGRGGGVVVFDRLATGNARPLAVIPGPRTGDQFALYPPNGLIITARGGLIEGWSLDEGLRLYANAPRSASDYAGMNRPLRDGYGLMAPNSLKRLWEFNPGFGGPLAQDRLWFYYSARHAGAQQNVQQFFNKNAGNPDVWTYEADTSRQFANENTIRNYANVRLTWQASQKHKVGFTFDGNTGYDIRGGGPRRAPEAFMSSHVDLSPRNRFILDWTAPVTNRVLLQSTVTRFWSLTARPRENLYFPRQSVPMIGVQEQSTGLRYRATPTASSTRQNHIRGTTSISYVTGAHGFKVGVEYGGAGHSQERFSPDFPMEFRFRNGVPNRITLHAIPSPQLTQNREAGAYVQDRWTINRLTLNGGLRYTYYSTFFPETFLGTGPFTPDRGVTFPKTDGVTWHDLGATGGMAFDVTGDGRTALKVSLGRYLAQAVLRGTLDAEWLRWRVSSPAPTGRGGIATATSCRIATSSTRAGTASAGR